MGAGYDQIAAFRAGRDPGFVADRDLLKVWIVTYGRDFGTADTHKFLRFSTASSMENLHTAIARLRDMLHVPRHA